MSDHAASCQRVNKQEASGAHLESGCLILNIASLTSGLMTLEAAAGSDLKGLDNAWRGAEAYHFWLLAHQQLYNGQVGCQYDNPHDVEVAVLLLLSANDITCMGNCNPAQTPPTPLPLSFNPHHHVLQQLTDGAYQVSCMTYSQLVCRLMLHCALLCNCATMMTYWSQLMSTRFWLLWASTAASMAPAQM